MTIRRGSLRGNGRHFGIVVSRFNEFITRRLLQGAVDTLKAAGTADRHIEIFWVPGALEMPFFLSRLASRKKFHALIALGCVLRGDTYHFECVSREVTRGISQAAMDKGVPIASGVITADTLEQAIDRAGLKAGNKGEQAALAALEIADMNLNLGKAGGGKRRRK